MEILHTPGHSRGHLSIYDPRSRVMLILDALLWNAVLTKHGEPAFPPTYRYVDTYLSSVQRIAASDPALLATSHYPLLSDSGEIAEFCAESAAFVHRTENGLRSLLQATAAPLTMAEIIDELSPLLGRWPASGAKYLVWPLSGHIERLRHYGRIETGRREGLLTLRWAT